MRLLYTISILSLLLFSCKNETKPAQKEETKPLTTAEKIANNYGFKHFKDITEIGFTFNVDRDSSHFERSWIWKPKSNEVTLITAKDTITYNRKSVDSTNIKADQGFINDKFWLLAPFQLIWDKSATISEVSKENTPISNVESNKITLTYPDNGGYTPGDAYDFYFDDNYQITEWVFRQGNSKEPSMINTWEDYQNFNGLNLSLTHKNKQGNFKLYFTNIKVVK